MEGSNQMNKSRLNVNTRRWNAPILLLSAMALLLAPASGGAQELGFIRARDVQNAGLERKGRRANRCGHYTSWLHYGHLQLGRLEDAAAGMTACRERMGDAPTRDEVGTSSTCGRGR